MAPAHPHATGVAVYPALLFLFVKKLFMWYMASSPSTKLVFGSFSDIECRYDSLEEAIKTKGTIKPTVQLHTSDPTLRDPGVTVIHQ